MSVSYKETRGQRLPVICAQCSTPFTLTRRVVESHRNAETIRCMRCHGANNRNKACVYPSLATPQELRDYWTNGGRTNDEHNPGPADRGRPLRQQDLASIVAGLEMWLDDREVP